MSVSLQKLKSMIKMQISDLHNSRILDQDIDDFVELCRCLSYHLRNKELERIVDSIEEHLLYNDVCDIDLFFDETNILRRIAQYC